MKGSLQPHASALSSLLNCWRTKTRSTHCTIFRTTTPPWILPPHVPKIGGSIIRTPTEQRRIAPRTTILLVANSILLAQCCFSSCRDASEPGANMILRNISRGTLKRLRPGPRHFAKRNGQKEWPKIGRGGDCSGQGARRELPETGNQRATQPSALLARNHKPMRRSNPIQFRARSHSVSARSFGHRSNQQHKHASHELFKNHRKSSGQPEPHKRHRRIRKKPHTWQDAPAPIMPSPARPANRWADA